MKNIEYKVKDKQEAPQQLQKRSNLTKNSQQSSLVTPFLMTTVLHLENNHNICPFLHTWSAHTAASVCVSTVAQCVVRDGRVRFCECLWEAILPTVRGLLHVTLFYTTQSTAGPGIVSVHECHHQKHLTCNPRMQMRRGGVGGGWSYGPFGKCIQEKRRKRWVPSPCSAPRLESFILWTLVHRSG